MGSFFLIVGVKQMSTTNYEVAGQIVSEIPVRSIN